MKTKPAMKTLTRAIAVTGFLKSGASGFSAFSKTPKITPVTKIGYLETVFQKFCMSLNENGVPLHEFRVKVLLFRCAAFSFYWTLDKGLCTGAKQAALDASFKIGSDPWLKSQWLNLKV